MKVRKVAVTVTTASDGSKTSVSESLMGRLIDIEYVKHGVTPFTDGVDFAIIGGVSGRGLWTEANVNASAIRAPRQATHAIDGSASLYAAAGEPVEDAIHLADETVTIAVTNGGDTKTGTFYITVA